jgi:hypothetical protein
MSPARIQTIVAEIYGLLAERSDLGKWGRSAYRTERYREINRRLGELAEELNGK